MIVLVTGVPGSGKTLYTISKLLQESFKDRTVYVNRIPNLILPHEVLSGDEDNPPPTSDVFHWFDGRVPNGSVIVIDEAQRVFRPRSATSAVPPHVAKLETHRHMGLDFVLITQHPQLIDVNVRRLVGRHLDVRRVFGFGGGALVYEWDRCQLDISNVRNASKRPFRYKKADFKLYKSAEVHTKPTNKVPGIVKMFFALLLVFPVVLWFGWKRYQRYVVEETPAVVPQGPVTGAVAGAGGLPVSHGGMGDVRDRPMTVQEYSDSLEPRVFGLQHTAPRYDDLTKPTRVPVPVSCVKMEKKGCKCYTQDATPYHTTQERCERIVEGGIFFDFVPDPGRDMYQAVNAVPPVSPDLPVRDEVRSGVMVIPHTPTQLAARKTVTGAKDEQ